MIEAVDLTKRYEDRVLALDALNLKVSPGEIYFLLGANGAGKTTVINLFLNFIEPTAGRALINKIDVTKEPLAAKKHVAYVAEDLMLYGNFTARQNLDFFARLGGQRGLKTDDYYQVLREVGLEEKAFEQKLKAFSKGMRQKIGLAIAMIKDAPAILLDEPTSGLDPKVSAELMETLVALRARGKAILISTHDIFRAREVADRVGIMKEGRKVIERTRAELEQEDLQTLYLDYMRSGYPSDFKSTQHGIS
ncbi:MAG TPA: ABC transporter ATP-binding protein [Pyrinomonadaceae bacterium]|jgi:ABC-2 type transport system ATP-binding protein|nr:ABC transporter ATP-binding protein [Pyrinomonadaceae bacterium]